MNSNGEVGIGDTVHDLVEGIFQCLRRLSQRPPEKRGLRGRVKRTA